MARRRAPDDIRRFKRIHNELMDAAKSLDNARVLLENRVGARTKGDERMFEALHAEVSTLRQRALDACMLLYLEDKQRRPPR